MLHDQHSSGKLSLCVIVAVRDTREGVARVVTGRLMNNSHAARCHLPLLSAMVSHRCSCALALGLTVYSTLFQSLSHSSILLCLLTPVFSLKLSRYYHHQSRLRARLFTAVLVQFVPTQSLPRIPFTHHEHRRCRSHCRHSLISDQPARLHHRWCRCLLRSQARSVEARRHQGTVRAGQGEPVPSTSCRHPGSAMDSL